MNLESLYAIGAVVLVSCISLIGVVTLFSKQRFVKKIVTLLVSLSAGTLIGDVFFHIIPELYEEKGVVQEIPIFILLGIVTFFVLEKIICWNHCHHEITTEHNHPLAITNLVGDGLHNLIDGLIIGASFAVSTEIGVATTIAVIAHEIPQEIGDFGVLVHAGLSPKRALILNFISAAVAIIGTFTALVVGDASENITYWLLAFAGGSFLYIAIADLIPEIKHNINTKKSVLQLLIFLLGILTMFGITYIGA